MAATEGFAVTDDLAAIRQHCDTPRSVPQRPAAPGMALEASRARRRATNRPSEGEYLAPASQARRIPQGLRAIHRRTR